MTNKSVAQINTEINTAKREGLRLVPNNYELLEDKTFSNDGNTLTDIVAALERIVQSGKQYIPVNLAWKIEQIFDRYPLQYKLLGLYHAGGFTTSEIAELEGITQQSVSKTLKSAITRLQKGLTDSEYDSIRWAVGVRKPIKATPKVDDSGYDNLKSSYAPSRWITVAGELNNHPPAKDLPVPRWVLHQEKMANAATS